MKTSVPLINFPPDVQAVLFLIREELKCRKLFSALHEAGLEECYWQPHLASLILQYIGLDDSDATFEAYDSILEKRSRKVKSNHNSVMKQTLKVYTELKAMKAMNPGSVA